MVQVEPLGHWRSRAAVRDPLARAPLWINVVLSVGLIALIIGVYMRIFFG